MICAQELTTALETRLLLPCLVDFPFSTDRSQSVGADAVIRDLTRLGHTVVVDAPLSRLVLHCGRGTDTRVAMIRYSITTNGRS